MTALLSWLIVPLCLLIAARAARRHSVVWRAEGAVGDGSPWVPVVVGLASTAFQIWVWGGLNEPTFIHDEEAYLLQAEIFANGAWSAPPPPIPEFFEQYHVLLQPRLVPKYPPGHALLLVPGVALGLRGLVPVLLVGLAGGLLFELARRIAGFPVSVLTWLLWLTCPDGLSWRSTYLSQNTSTVVWLLVALCLESWWRERHVSRLYFVAMLVGWMGITRPWTAMALALPVAGLVLNDLRRRREWRPLAVSLALFCAVMAIVPVWSRGAMGRFSVLPYAEYSRVYFPYQRLGFGVAAGESQRELPADMRTYDSVYRQIHSEHRLRHLPGIAMKRLAAIGAAMFEPRSWRGPLFLLFLLGMIERRPQIRFGGLWLLSLVAAYLAYAHRANWTVYYVELQAFLALVTACGTRIAFVNLLRTTASELREIKVAAAMAAVSAVVAALGAADSFALRQRIRTRTAYHRAFAAAIAKIPESKSVVFVRYGPRHNIHRSLISNPPDYEGASTWIVRDRGDDNLRLLQMAPGRSPYLFDEQANVMRRLASSVRP